jgi:hypothetical protein
MSIDQFRHLDIDEIASKVRLHTINVSDYRMVTPTIARVIISCTGQTPHNEDLRAEIASMFQDLASPVQGSFRRLQGDGPVTTVVGFIKANREVKSMEEVDKTRMKVMSSNLMMSKDDKSLWEVRKGSSGEYLVRQGEEDLSELVALARRPKVGIPKLTAIASMPAEPKEFAAYVDLKLEEVQHGFVVASEKGIATILSSEGDEVVQCSTDCLVEVCHLDEEDEKMISPKMATAGMDKSAMIEYYKKAYSYAPDYVAKIIEMIGQHAFA